MPDSKNNNNNAKVVPTISITDADVDDVEPTKTNNTFNKKNKENTETKDDSSSTTSNDDDLKDMEQELNDQIDKLSYMKTRNALYAVFGLTIICLIAGSIFRAIEQRTKSN